MLLLSLNNDELTADSFDHFTATSLRQFRSCILCHRSNSGIIQYYYTCSKIGIEVVFKKSLFIFFPKQSKNENSAVCFPVHHENMSAAVRVDASKQTGVTLYISVSSTNPCLICHTNSQGISQPIDDTIVAILSHSWKIVKIGGGLASSVSTF